jgi:hypothetical protein
MTRRADPKNLYRMAGFGESVLGRDSICPVFDASGVDFNGSTAVAADQVVVVPGRTGAIDQFAIVRVENIGIAGQSEVGERSIDGREADG